MLFCPTGQSLLRNAQRPKKSGKNAAGNDYFVSKAPARQVSVRKEGREGRYLLPASAKREGMFPPPIMADRHAAPVLSSRTSR